MSKARDLADSVSTGGILEDGAVSVSEISDLTVTAAELNNVAGVNSDVQTQLDLKAPLASPTFTGTVDITGTLTSDGLTVDGAALINTSTYFGINSNTPQIRMLDLDSSISYTMLDASSGNFIVDVDANNATAGSYFAVKSDGSERMRISSSGEIGLSGANYGTAGQVLTSSGSGAAPTWADAAGGGTVEMTASGGDISQGDFVNLNADGTVTSFSISGGPSTIVVSITNDTGEVYKNKGSIAYDSTNNIICLGFSDAALSDYPHLLPGKITNGIITWGTKVQLDNNPAYEFVGVEYDTQANVWAAIYDRSVYVFGKGFTVDSTTLNITQGSNVELHGQFNSGGDAGLSWVTNSGQSYGTFVGWFRSNDIDGLTLRSFYVSLSGSTPTLNLGYTEYVYSSMGDAQEVVAFDNDKLMCLLKVNNTNITLKTYTLTSYRSFTSEDTHSITTPLSGRTVYKNNIAYNSTDDEWLIVFTDISSNDGIYAMPFTYSFSGGTFNVSSPTRLLTEYGSNSDQHKLEYDVTLGKFVYLTGQSSGSNTDLLDGINILLLSSSASSGTVSIYDQLLDGTQNTNVAIRYVPDLSKAVYFAYAVDPLKAVGTSRVPTWLGVAKENITSGSSGNIYIMGGVADNQSGLTPNTVYYLDANSQNLTTSATDYKVGRALTSTKLLITEGNA